MKNKTNSKAKLDSIIAEFQAQPVGSGYIDIIVSRENYRSFAAAVLDNGFEIEAVSWWEYIDQIDAKNSYGIGGPPSRYYPGWFAEVGTHIDNIKNGDDWKQTLLSIVDLIENKIIWDDISFKETHSLTPAFWLKVNKSWKSRE